MNRRGFLGAILAAAAAPAIVRAASLMPVAAPKVWTPPDTIFTGEIGRHERVRMVVVGDSIADHFIDAMRYGIGIASMQVVKDAQRAESRLTRICLEDAFKKINRERFHAEPYRFGNQ